MILMYLHHSQTHTLVPEYGTPSVLLLKLTFFYGCSLYFWCVFFHHSVKAWYQHFVTQVILAQSTFRKVFIYWANTIKELWQIEMKRCEEERMMAIPRLKAGHVFRDSWIRPYVTPAKIMHVHACVHTCTCIFNIQWTPPYGHPWNKDTSINIELPLKCRHLTNRDTFGCPKSLFGRLKHNTGGNLSSLNYCGCVARVILANTINSKEEEKILIIKECWLKKKYDRKWACV